MAFFDQIKQIVDKEILNRGLSNVDELLEQLDSEVDADENRTSKKISK